MTATCTTTPTTPPSDVIRYRKDCHLTVLTCFITGCYRRLARTLNHLQLHILLKMRSIRQTVIEKTYGIISKDKQLSETLRPKQCPNCNEPNKPDSRFCAKCRMVLTYDAYSETLESEKQKDDKLSIMEKQFNVMQSQIQSLISTLTNLKEQGQVNAVVQTLYSSGILKEGKGAINR
jgi:hypothetical protein